MPSGAKKRKAAKKKKGKETNTNPSTNNPQGNDELKSHDDKGSDGGEGVSPTHHDHDDDHHHPFNEENEEADEGNSSAVDAKSVKEVPVDIQIHEAVGQKEDVGSVVIERDSTSKENGERKEAVQTNPANESDYVDAKDLNDEANNAVKEAVTYDELVKSIDSSHAKMTHIAEDAPLEKTGGSVESVKPLSSVSDANGRDTGNALSNDNVRRSSLEDPKPKEFDNNELPHVYRGPLPESTNATEYVKDSEAPESSEYQPLVASAPRIAQKTSWLSCCGLFEVLSGSNR